MPSNFESPQQNSQELKDRLNLIEQMIAEGRRTTESWGWTFVLWGVAYYVAIAWATLGKGSLAWPVTMVAAGILTAVLASRSASKRPETTVGRAMMAIWLGMGVSIFALMVSLGMSGRLDEHVSVAIIGTMLGAANCTSSIILKWKMQFASAVVWWGTAIAACFTSDTVTSIVFLTAIFFCQIVFGIYGMIAEASKQKRHEAGQGASHA
jgi:fatty acid desaturase